MPFGGPRTEALGEAGDKGVGERNFGQEDQRLPPGAQRIGHRLEENFGLAAASHAIEQRDAELVRVERGNLVERLLLVGRQRRDGTIRVGWQHDRRRRHFEPFDRPGPLQSLDDRGRDPRSADQRGLWPGHVIHQRVEHAQAGRRQLFRLVAGAAKGNHRLGRIERLGGPQNGTQHLAGGRQRIARHPVHQLEQFLAERRNIVGLGDVAQPIMRHHILGRSPDHAQGETGTQRHGHDRATRHHHAWRDTVAVGSLDGNPHHDGDDVWTVFHLCPFCSHRNIGSASDSAKGGGS